jgi:hypothetical protein
LVSNLEDIRSFNLNAEHGEAIASKESLYAAYDESILKYSALEGIAYFTSHSLVIVGRKDYIPLNLITFYFYTRSKSIKDTSKFIKHVDKPELESKRDYFKDRINFLDEFTPEGTLLFIDGPLIGGDLYTYMIDSVSKFLNKDIVPIFFVKNSDSNLVTDHIPSLKGEYNSDMHWSYNALKKGQRTSFFKYADKNNPDNAKVFCYLKAYDLSPQRVEFQVDVYHKHQSIISMIMDLVYYLLLVQGDMRNPQIRPIAIAEKYARETLGMINIFGMMKKSGLVPTMNQERFGG